MNSSAVGRLMKAFRNGNKKAFEEIYNIYHKRLVYFARNITGNQEEAKDITSETFVKLWQLRTRFETLQNIQAFLFITARNASINYLRSLKRVAGDINDYYYTESLSDESTIEREMIEVEVLQKIYEEIENLPGKCQKVFKMSYIDRFKNEDIASQLKITLQTVKNHKTRALNIIRMAISAIMKKQS